MGRGQDIKSIDFLVTGSRHGPLDGRIRGQDFVKNLPPGRAELFGIVQSMADEISRQDHGRGGDRTGEWPSPRFINPGDPEKAASVKNEFEGQVGHEFDSESAEALAGGHLRGIHCGEKLGAEHHPVIGDDHAETGVGPGAAHVVIVVLGLRPHL